MQIVHVLYHVHQMLSGREDVKLIGIYTSRSKAEDAIQRLSHQPGFTESKGGFEIHDHVLDKDSWTEGFVTVQ